MPNWKKLLTSGSDASLNSLHVDVSINAASLTGSLSYDNLTGVPTLISSSEQVTLTSTNGFSTFSSSIDNHLDANISVVNTSITNLSSSLDSRIATEKSRVDAILLSADADKDSFAEIVSLINSVDTTNDNAFASFYTASTGRLSSLEAYTASLQGTSLVSGSSQITISDTVGYVAFSSSIDSHLDANVTTLNTTINNLSSSTATALRAEYVAGDSAISSSAHTQRVALINSLSSSVDSHLDANILALSSSVDTHLDNIVTTLSSSIATDIVTLNTFSSSLQTTQYSFTGSFSGDGSGLTGVSVVETTTVLDTFSNEVSYSVSHNFGTKNVIVTVYNNNDSQIIPESVTTSTDNQVDITFCESTSGRVVVAKGGHLVSGSIELFTVRESVSGSTTYSITHNLNEDYPIVQAYDNTKKQVLPQEIESLTVNSITVSFCDPFTGIIVIKK